MEDYKGVARVLQINLTGFITVWVGQYAQEYTLYSKRNPNIVYDISK